VVDEFRDIPFAEGVLALGLEAQFDGRTTLWTYDTAEQAIARIEADTRLKAAIESSNADWREFERRKVRHPWVIRHYPTHAVVAGGMDLDDGLGRDYLAGLVVDGDLEIFGSLINWEPDTAPPFIVVRGSLHCESLIVSGSDMAVQDHVTAANLVAVTDNHGQLDVGGNVIARYFIMGGDGWSRVGGSIRAAGWNSSLNAQLPLRRSDWPHEIRREFRNEFLDEGGYLKSFVAPYQALLDGRDILRR
jgi:hypothetical protein